MVALPSEENEGAEVTVRDVVEEYNRAVREYTGKEAMDEMMDYVTAGFERKREADGRTTD